MIIDHNKIADIRALMGHEFPVLITTYIDDNKNRINQLGKCKDRLDYAMIKMLSHTMKSSSANIGVVSISMISEQIEVAAGTKNIQVINEQFKQLQLVFPEVELQLRAII